MKQNRVQRAIEKMKENNLSQMLVSSSDSLFYLTGKWFHTGERMIALLIREDGNHKLIINKMFPVDEQIGVDVVRFEDTDNPTEILAKYIDKDKTLGVDKKWPAHFLISLMKSNAAKDYENASPIVDDLRRIKDAEEIAIMKEASRLNDEAMEELWTKFEEGKTENYYAEVLKDIYAKQGVNEVSFTPIIAFCPNGADPHHETDDTKLKKGQSIVIDMGGVYKDYCSDMTRTIFFGEEPSEEHKKIYNIVKEANERAIAMIKPGVKFKDIDNAARSYIAENGYGEYFTHRTGHCIGIECHDAGDVSGTNENVVEPGMIFSIEPGVYLKDNFGVRIEDLVLVTEDGCERLNKVTKELTVIK
ncbi:MAG: aminopeptidase P family protein [Clostridium baratii]|uniref:Metallopeptidase M24 family protein n=1 Tax=Clostridium baratii str. Sullivan TaxID=1415775 RepID=A0A0A7FW94_9CLOT|nr:Xaa-Pro peptidase family protein [Clostridium baratii]AIY83823.1 metallopeptidase M24 family protein [Clostridium baratii str. Sullivan]MBS6007877.1 aminopeptidase P family protein [Clostridium baratii]MDU1054672.1 Xaa-Pro peptidase family protein [Clostridium baratii]MDU4911463.1 Xaa-Pro peptidase family protein [Clostridium baratii]